MFQIVHAFVKVGVYGYVVAVFICFVLCVCLSETQQF